MIHRLYVVLIALACVVGGCASPQTNTVTLPPPTQSTTLGPGDVFEMNIVGEDKLPTTYMVSPDGSVDFPYVHRMHVEGMEPQAVVDALRNALISQGYFKDPSVMVRVTEYKSKVVSVLGQVKNPGTFPLVPGFTLVQALSRAGGPAAVADVNNIMLTRTTGKVRRTIRLSLQSITEGRSADVPLQSGDVITVGERVF